jgi:hypothetical protein
VDFAENKRRCKNKRFKNGVQDYRKNSLSCKRVDEFIEEDIEKRKLQLKTSEVINPDDRNECGGCCLVQENVLPQVVKSNEKNCGLFLLLLNK